MKLKKVYDEIIKASLNNDKAKIFLGKLEDKIAVSTDGFIMYFVPEKDFIFDIEKILRGRGRFNAKELTKDEPNAKPASRTGETKELLGKIAVKIGDKWVNEKYLKAFENPTFKNTDNYIDPVYVYEGDELVGLVMPIRIRDGEKK